MRLTNLKTPDGNHIVVTVDGRENDKEVAFNDVIAFPGLINSHDHLEFNLFPSYGDRTYRNYREWGRHLLQRYKDEISKVLRIPLPLRTQWGLYKNLLCGVTTVINHGIRLRIDDPIIGVRQESQSLHSVKFEKLWKLKINNPLLRKRLCTIHIGEGIDTESAEEIDTLLNWNFLKRDLVGIHGVAMRSHHAVKFKALVWCPMSNYFLFNATAKLAQLQIPIVFGTDSTLTASWNIWDHIRLAHMKCGIQEKQLLDMVTYTPAALWRIEGYEQHDQPQDLVIARTENSDNGADRFLNVNPDRILLIVRRREMVLIDDSVFDKLGPAGEDRKKYFAVKMGDTKKWVKGNLPLLIRQIRHYHPEQTFPVNMVKQ